MVLFGATSVGPGRVNVLGTVLAVLVLAAAVSGLQQLGARAYDEPLFNGGMLIIAVAIAAHVAARRQAGVKAAMLRRGETNKIPGSASGPQAASDKQFGRRRLGQPRH